jgi:hypothetical protein
VTAVPNVASAIKEINRRPEPLSLYIFAEDAHVQDLLVSNTSSGGVTINHCIFHAANPNLPFGGVGNSGMGAYHGMQRQTERRLASLLGVVGWVGGWWFGSPLLLWRRAVAGKRTFTAFSHSKPVLIKSKWPDFGLISDAFYLYPPWTGLKEKILRASQPLF